MLYRTLGKTGLIVSAVSLGALEFGSTMIVRNLDQRAALSVLAGQRDRYVSGIDICLITLYTVCRIRDTGHLGDCTHAQSTGR